MFAVLRYRQLYWLRVDALRAGEPDPVVRADSCQARSDVTEARDRLALVVTDEALLRAASRAAWSAQDLSEIDPGTPQAGRYAPATEAQLDVARERSRDAHTELRQAATGYGTRTRRRQPITEHLTADRPDAPRRPRRPPGLPAGAG